MASTCEILPESGGNLMIENVLATARVIVILGVSPDPARPSNGVMGYLLHHHFTVIPVNPTQSEILGQRCLKSLGELDLKVDIVDVFRAPPALPGIMQEISDYSERIGVKPAIWLQPGAEDEAAISRAESEGYIVVSKACIAIEHHKLSR